MRQRTAWERHAVLAVVLLVGSGCSSPGEEAATEVAEQFVLAIEREDATAACDLLAPATRQELEQSATKPCPEAILEEGRAAGKRTQVHVYGVMAQVEFDTDTVFLSRFDEQWLVLAASCNPGPHTVHDCSIQGR